MNKKLFLSSAIAAALGAATSAQALDLTPDSNTTLGIADAPGIYASELVIGGDLDLTLPAQAALSGTTLANSNVVGQFGAGASSGATRFLRFDLDEGATFVDPVVAGDLNVENADNANTAILTGGGMGEDFVIFQVESQGIDADDNFAVALPEINVDDQGTVTLLYRQFEVGTEADSEGTDFPSARADGPLIRFEPFAEFSTDINDNVDRIEVTEQSEKFTTTNESDALVANLGAVVFEEGDGALLADATDMTVVGNFDNVVATAGLSNTDTNIRLSGNFLADAVFTDCSGSELANLGATTPPVDSQGRVVIDRGNVADTTDICYGVPGDVTIPETEVSVDYLPVGLAASTPTIPNGTDPASDSGDLADVLKNGSVDTVPFGTSTDEQFYRITNPTVNAGEVLITVFDRVGNECKPTLVDLGEASNELGAQSSTSLITGLDIANECPGLTTSAIRVVVDGAFGDNDNAQGTGEGRADGIRLDAFNAQGFNTNR